MPKTTNPLTRKRGPSTNVILSVVVVVAAVVVIGGVLLFAGQRNGAGDQTGRVPASVLSPPGSSTVSEAPGNKVTLVEFLDYQCPACYQTYHSLTKQLEKKYEGRITFVTRNFPLEMHPLARLAASAAEAAGMQGKYEEMYHALYDNWQDWAIEGNSISDNEQRARQSFDRFAREIGLDLERFHRDLNSPEVAERIERDLADGKRAGVDSTPTMFLNGRPFSPGSLQEASRKIDGLLAK